jgi:glucose-6-phosphate isomerase
MDLQRLLARLEAHPMSAWQRPETAPLPAADPAARLLWAGIGGSLLPAGALVGGLGHAAQKARFVPLASPEPQEDLGLDRGDQVVFASKSGRTLELWTWLGRLRASSSWASLDRPPIAITQDDDNPLARLARAEGWPLLPIPEHVGGRYSAFTAIGTLPLAWMAKDAGRFVQSARDVREQCALAGSPWGSRIRDMVQAWTDGYVRSIDQWVLLPYANALEPAGAWWVQLVAESLGKTGADGIRRGINPVRAIGPQDQHAQLQRWLDGPRNVGVVLLTIPDTTPDPPCALPGQNPFPGLAGLGGGRILRAQAEGTREALEAARVPVLHWELNTLDEGEFGALLMAWQLIVALVGIALEVDPFNQPAVEDGKRRTLKMLGLA